jgi:hypothetical protein
MKITWTIALACLVALTGCTHSQYQGGTRKVNESQVRICLPPYFNATDDDHAARALTEITASALMNKGIPLVQTEPALAKIRQDNAAGADGLFLEAAKSLGATHLLIGTVHEYRYKTDLDGDPAVGITLRLVDAKEGNTLWQGSSAKVGVCFASLSSAAQYAVKRLVNQLPLYNNNARFYSKTGPQSADHQAVELGVTDSRKSTGKP